jgi:hypothetical protein
MSDKSCCRSKFKSKCNSIVICAHFSSTYISAYTVVLYNC